jgi:hypothetical protein
MFFEIRKHTDLDGIISLLNHFLNYLKVGGKTRMLHDL